MALPIAPATRNRLLAIGIIGFCAVCVAVPRPWHGSARGIALGAARPPHRALAAVHDGLRRAIGRCRALWADADELQRLRDENHALREALARQADQTRSARGQLRNLEGFQTFRTQSPIRTLTALPAAVVAADASPWRHHLIVNRGSVDGVRAGAAAVWGNSIVGTVVDVRRRAATVRLLSDSRAGITVRVARTGDVGLLRGASRPDGTLDLKWIHLQPIHDGDTIITAGIDPVIPPGLIAGRIVQASATRQPLFYQASVRPLLDLDRLTDLLLVAYSPDAIDDLLREEDQPGE